MYVWVALSMHSCCRLKAPSFYAGCSWRRVALVSCAKICPDHKEIVAVDRTVCGYHLVKVIKSPRCRRWVFLNEMQSGPEIEFLYVHEIFQHCAWRSMRSVDTVHQHTSIPRKNGLDFIPDGCSVHQIRLKGWTEVFIHNALFHTGGPFRYNVVQLG